MSVNTRRTSLRLSRRFSKIALIILFATLSIARGASLPNETEMTFARNTQGKAMFACTWFPAPQIAVCNLALNWINFDSVIHERGLMLDKAREKRMVSPKLPSDCMLASFKGVLTPQAGRVFSFNFNLKGPECELVAERLRSEIISFEFIDAPAAIGSDIFPVATMKMLELPD